jgi:hypothetical protein
MAQSRLQPRYCRWARAVRPTENKRHLRDLDEPTIQEAQRRMSRRACGPWNSAAPGSSSLRADGRGRCHPSAPGSAISCPVHDRRRVKSRPASRKPNERVATGPCQVWSWGITYPRSALRGYIPLELFRGWGHRRRAKQLNIALPGRPAPVLVASSRRRCSSVSISMSAAPGTFRALARGRMVRRFVR